jgi:hypothetical protein
LPDPGKLLPRQRKYLLLTNVCKPAPRKCLPEKNFALSGEEKFCQCKILLSGTSQMGKYLQKREIAVDKNCMKYKNLSVTKLFFAGAKV